MPKAIFNILNVASASLTPLHTFATVQNQNFENNNQKFDFDLLLKIFRKGYSEENRSKNIDKPVEVLVRIKDGVDFSEYEKDKDITKIIDQYDKQNDKFVSSLKEKLMDLQVARYSHTSPYVTFIFKNRKNLELNLLLLAMSNDSVVVNSNEEEDIALEASAEKNFINLTYTVPYNKSLIEKQFETVGFDEQRKKETVARELQPDLFKTNVRKIKVGIFEAGNTISRNNPAFKNKKLHFMYGNINEQADSHADLVAAVATGENGVDRFVEDIYSVYEDRVASNYNLPAFSSWMSKMDYLISSGVHVINNSWSYELSGSYVNQNKSTHGYNEQAYYLDFLTRKYGVINVWSSGNTQQRGDYVINSGKLSQNSVVVGSTNLSGSQLSNFSEYRTGDSKIMTKPLIVAPGEEYEFFSTSNSKQKLNYKSSGTSFSAPLVTGLITTLLRNNYHLIGKPEAILAILTAGSKQMSAYTDKQSNGLNDKVGAGLVNYELMQKAARNLVTLNISDSVKEQFISLGYLTSGKQLSVSTAWLFDAGYLANSEYAPTKPNDYDKRPNWIHEWDWLNYVPFGFIGYLGKRELFEQDVRNWLKMREEFDKAEAEYNAAHSSLNGGKYKHEWNSIDHLKSKYGEGWYTPTDVDLRIEKYNPRTGSWESVASSVSGTSNVEFIRHNITDSANYRAVVKQYSDNKGAQNVKGALAYVVQ